jgi:hypothetical protein
MDSPSAMTVDIEVKGEMKEEKRKNERKLENSF